MLEEITLSKLSQISYFLKLLEIEVDAKTTNTQIVFRKVENNGTCLLFFNFRCEGPGECISVNGPRLNECYGFCPRRCSATGESKNSKRSDLSGALSKNSRGSSVF